MSVGDEPSHTIISTKSAFYKVMDEGLQKHLEQKRMSKEEGTSLPDQVANPSAWMLGMQHRENLRLLLSIFQRPQVDDHAILLMCPRRNKFCSGRRTENHFGGRFIRIRLICGAARHVLA
jgi:hypothetical protein